MRNFRFVISAGSSCVNAKHFTPRSLAKSVQPTPLTDRQARLLGYVVQGLTDRQIALRLAISESGVKKHLQLIFAKLGTSNRIETAAIALRKHLLKI